MANEFQPAIDYYVKYFSDKGEEGLKIICSLAVPVEILCVGYKYLPPIPETQIEELRSYSKELFPDKEDNQIENIMKAIYTIGTLL